MMLSKKNIARLNDLLSETKKIVIVTHANPDGDAMGSSLGLYHLLIQQKHKVQVIIPDASPAFLNWLPGVNKIQIGDRNPKLAEKSFKEAQLIFCVDFNSPSRINILEEMLVEAKGTKVMIDHHPQPAECCDMVFSEVKASSTAEIISDLITEAGWEEYLNKNVADCLYTGIMTDTGNFRFSSTSSKTHRIVANLVDAGADNTSIYENIYDSNSESRLRLLGYCLHEKLKVLSELSTAFITLTKDDLSKFNFKKGDTEGVVNYALSIQGIKFAAFFRESDENIRISFRSKGDFNVNEFSRKNFNGGGHPNAAGGKSDVSMDETIMNFVNLLPEYRAELTKK